MKTQRGRGTQPSVAGHDGGRMSGTLIFGRYQYTRRHPPATANIGGIHCRSVGSFLFVPLVCHGWNVMVLRCVQCCFQAAATLAGTALCWSATPARSDPAPNDYPTYARVEYVQECMIRNGGNLAYLYKCSCVIDRLAEHFTYDEFVEASTFVHYAAAPGEAGGIFRDPERAKERTKLYRSLEAEAYRACGLKPPAGAPR